MKLRCGRLYILLFAVLSASFNLFSQENVSPDASETKEIKTETKSETKQETKKEEKKNVIPEYENILNSSAALHMFTYKDENTEHLVLHHTKSSGDRSVIQNSGKKTKRFFYNENMILFCVEYWVTEKKVSDSYLEKITFYSYGDDSSKSIFGKQNYSIETNEYNLKDNTKIQIFYNSDGLVVERNEYSILGVDEDSKLEISKNTKLIKNNIRREYSFFYKYDSAGQVIQEDELHLEYRTPQAVRVKKSSTRKNVYEYIRSDCPPVTTFYENNVLRMKTVYSSNNDYVQNIYFDNNTYVKVQYKDSKKVSEVFYVDGKVYE